MVKGSEIHYSFVIIQYLKLHRKNTGHSLENIGALLLLQNVWYDHNALEFIME